MRQSASGNVGLLTKAVQNGNLPEEPLGTMGLLTKAHFKQSQARLHSPKHEIRLHTRLTMASASGFFTRLIPFTNRFRFRADAERRHCSNTFSMPLFRVNLKLWQRFCKPKFPSQTICLCR